MKFGLTGRAGGFELAPPGQVPEMARKFGESLGFQALWMQEEHFIEGGGPSVCLSPLILGAAIAARTEKLRIGFSVLLLPLHNPLRLAEDAATLDVLSSGRMDFGISRGFQGRYFDAYKVDAKVRSERFRKNLDYILRCWQDENLSSGGKKYSVQPKPTQKPHPPIYVATYHEQQARWVARSRYFLMQHALQSEAHLAKIFRAYEDAGGSMNTVPVSRFVYVSEDDASARRELQTPVEGLTTFLKRIQIYRNGIVEPEQLEPGRFLEEMVISGSPKTVIETVRNLRSKYGVDYLNCLIAFYGFVPMESMLRSLLLMSKHVLPALGQ
jgi:alkanesulfonate monooxygenase SsuD/methylene tetrahydromethanopterin reductase-like flavin-dependent oxidoreductase (luciferase family)